jgi:hypothetical protein
VVSAAVVVLALLTSAVGCTPGHSGPDAQAAALPAATTSRPLTVDDVRVDDAGVTDGLAC